MPVWTLGAGVLLFALSALGTPGQVWAQTPPRNPGLVEAVTSNPAAAPQLVAREVTAGAPDAAPPIVGDAVGALPSGQRLSLAPRVVSAAIAALPAPQRGPLAPACACAAIRAVPASERQGVVPAIVAAAVSMAPVARDQIVTCAVETAPELSAVIIAAAAEPPFQPELASPPTSPLPGSTIGRDVLFRARFNTGGQICASPPCP